MTIQKHGWGNTPKPTEEDEEDEENKAERVQVRAGVVTRLKASIPKCDACGQDTQYVDNQMENCLGTPPPTLVFLQTHFACVPLLALRLEVQRLTAEGHETNARLRRLEETKPSLHVRIREGVRRALFVMAEKL